MLSIVIPWCDRDELTVVAPRFRETASDLGAEIVAVNYAGDPDWFATASASLGADVIVSVVGEGYFNKPAASNIGAHHASGRFVFFCDNDILLDGADLAALLDRVAATPSTFGTLASVTETERNSRKAGHVTRFGYTLEMSTSDGRELTIRDHEEDANDGTRQAPGLLLVGHDDFRRVGGYNGQLDGWGWEDQDMIARLTLGAGLTRVSHGCAKHVSHGDDARVRRHRVSYADRWESRDKSFRRALANYDAADFSGTYEWDVSRLTEDGAVRVERR